MTETRRGLWAYAALVLALVVSLVLGVSYPQYQPGPDEIVAQAIKDTEFRSVYIEHDLDVDGAVTFDSTFDVDGATTLTSLDVDGGSITMQNDETIGNATDNYITLGGGVVFNSTTISVTEAQVITPTIYSGYRLDAAGAVTITLAVCSQDFQLLVLYGEGSQAITINDTNVRTNDGGVQAIGQYDVITWMCIKAEWVELSESNNS